MHDEAGGLKLPTGRLPKTWISAEPCLLIPPLCPPGTSPNNQRNYREADQEAVQAAVSCDASGDEQPVQASKVQYGVSLRLLDSGVNPLFESEGRKKKGKRNKRTQEILGWHACCLDDGFDRRVVYAWGTWCGHKEL